MRLLHKDNEKPIVNMSMIKVIWDGFQANIFIVNLVIIQKWRFKHYE